MLNVASISVKQHEHFSQNILKISFLPPEAQGFPDLHNLILNTDYKYKEKEASAH